MAGESGILVVGEIVDGALAGMSAELLGAARRLVEATGGQVSIALLGAGAAGVAQSAISLGADRAYVDGADELTQFTPDAWVPVVEQIAGQVNPALILIGQTSIGRDLAPHLAFRLKTGVAMDTLELTARDGAIVMTRACFGGNARE